MNAIKSEATIALRRDMALLLKRLRAIRRLNLPPQELRQRVSVALAEGGSLAQFVAVTTPHGEPRGCRVGVNKAAVRTLEGGVCAPPFAAQPADCL
jgi:hypothetical protein